MVTLPLRNRIGLAFLVWSVWCGVVGAGAAPLEVHGRADGAALEIRRPGAATPVLTQHAGAEMRPYLHPLTAPDGHGVLTEAAPGERAHETGIFWAYGRLNGRDYFRNPGAGYWRRVALRIVQARGAEVSWETVYDLPGADGRPLLRETQRWTMRDYGTRFELDLEWTGRAESDVTIGEQAAAGLAVRMPWRPGMTGQVTNNNRQRNERADGQRDVWIDLGLRVEGRRDLAHLTLFDHPRNRGYPQPWRVDRQFGVGLSRTGLGDLALKPGEEALARHRILVHTGTLDDVAVTEAWKRYTGERHDSAVWNLARAEARTAQFLTGEQAIAKMTVPAGFEVTLFAAEPQITQPMAFCWDDRGRLWVAENRDYETRQRGFSGSGDSRILILEDTDGDGKMDVRKTFLDGIPFPAAIAWGFGGLWLGAPPNLLFVPDRDGDDRADTGIEVRLTGWGIQDRHETLNSLVWGPDGWLYGCQGYATRSNVGQPADGGKVYRPGEPFPENPAVRNPQYLDGGVWRYHPTKDRFEVVAHGFSNPWGLDFDDHGQMFITACVIPHLWHVVPGGVYHRQGGRHINPHVYNDIKTIADHRHRSAHGGARIYLADAFPAEHRGRIFMANIHEHALLSDTLEPRGSGFVGRHGDDVLLANDPQWVGFSVETGPEGAVYLLDWHDGDICGMATHNKDTGRIFRLAPKGLRGVTGLDLAKRTDLELVALQTHRNDWYVRRARTLLQERAAAGRLDSAVGARLWELFAQAPTAAGKLRALWALHVTGNAPADRLAGLLTHTEPYVRAWAIQLLGEDGAPAPAVLATLARRAAEDPSPVVRLYLASLLQRLPAADRWPLVEGLMRHAGDATDHNLPLMLWFGFEPLAAAEPGRALATAMRSAVPPLAQYTARRVAAEKNFAAVTDAAARAPLAMRQQLLTGLRDALAAFGRSGLVPPENWSAVEATLLAGADAAVRELVQQIARLFGDAKAAAGQLALLQNPTAPAEQRRTAVTSFGRDPWPAALPALLGLLDDAALRREAIRALAAYEDARIAPEILQRFARWPAGDRAEAILTLASRRPTAQALLAALRRGAVAKPDVSAFAARQLLRVLGPGFGDFWGPIAPPAEAGRQEIAKWKEELTDAVLARANPAKGRAVFERTCASCHTLYGSGGKIGPDITGSNRANLDYILAEIVTPSDVIQEGYHLVTITTRDGRTLAGNVAAEDERQVTLRLIGQDTVVAKAEILARETATVSMMPEGLLGTLTKDEVRDLIAYLRTTEQVPLPPAP